MLLSRAFPPTDLLRGLLMGQDNQHDIELDHAVAANIIIDH